MSCVGLVIPIAVIVSHQKKNQKNVRSAVAILFPNLKSAENAVQFYLSQWSLPPLCAFVSERCAQILAVDINRFLKMASYNRPAGGIHHRKMNRDLPGARNQNVPLS